MKTHRAAVPMTDQSGYARYGMEARVKRAPSVMTRTVPCPDCKVEVGVSCIKDDGTPRNSHPSRRRMATRKANQERGI